MRDHIGLFFLTIILCLSASLGVCGRLAARYSLECSQICGCQGGAGCSCVAAKPTVKCECRDCSCEKAVR